MNKFHSLILHLQNLFGNDIEVSIRVDLFPRKGLDKFFPKIVQQNIHIEPSILANNVIEIFKEFGMDHLLYTTSAPDKHEVSFSDFLMLL